MPPKKVLEPERKPLIGRVGTSLRAGIVGVPNVGKSTFFNVLTKSSAAAENFPFCTIDPNENNYTSDEMGDNEGKNILQDYNSDQTIICREQFMKAVATKEIVTNTEQTEETRNFDIHDWYPFVNSYYTYTENLDAFARVNHLLASKVSTTSLSTVSTTLPPEPSSFYSERDAQNSYLRSKPISFLILGKPMIGEEELGRLLADYWKCVYIDPEILIKEEIASGSRAGVCIEFNLRCGRAIGVDVIVRLIEKRVKTQTVLHRGFVLCGLPVIPNDLYEEDPVSSESAVFNVLEIFDELLESAFDAMPQPSRPHVSISSIAKSEEGLEDEEDPEGQGAESVAEEQTEADQIEKKIDTPLLDTIPLEIGVPLGPVCSVPTIGTNYEEQLNYIFEFFSDPYMIIYITCNNQDVISKRQEYRFDIYSQSTIDLQKERTNKIIFSLFNRDHGYDVPNIAEEFLDAQRNIGVDSSQLTHLVRLPINFAANVQTELDRFHQMATELIEKRVLEHDQQYFLKVDGRTTATRMFNSVKWRLRILPIHRVLIPELLNVVEPYGGGENEEPVKFTTEGLTLDQCFREFSKRQIASRLYKWTWSDWETKCPVSMFEGKYVDGTPDFAVHFMNKIFFLLDHDTFIKFYRNPRPYLLPPFPTSHAKIFIFGPNFSGKSAVADAFGYILNATVLNHIEMQNQFIEDRKLELIERVRQAALNEAMMILNEERRLKALEQKKLREGKIKYWLREFKRFVIFENERLKNEKRKGMAVISSFPLLMIVGGENEDKSRQIFESDIEFNIFLNEYTCAELLQNEAEMKRYLPEELSKSQVEEKIIPATAFDEFVLEKADQAVANFEIGDIVLDDDDLLEMYAIAIKKIEDEYMQREHCLGGWIIDGMPYNVNLVQKLVALYPPDHTIILEDRSSEFLSERCKTRGENVFVDYKDLFVELDKPEAAARAPAEESMKYKIRLVQDIILDLLDSVSFPDSESKVEIKGINPVNFEGNLEQIKIFLMDATNLPLIEIDVANKTVKDMVKETIKTFEDRYRQKPFIFTDEDRLQEAEDFRDITETDEAAGEGYDGIDGDRGFEANRRYGDTYHYCPVTFHDKWVLWKGKEEFIASYQGKVHLFSCEADMDAFVADCLKYLPINKPFVHFPPPRICVIGNSRSGKTSVSKALSRNYGLCYVSFMDYLQNVQISDSENINIQNYLQSDEPLPESVLTTVLSKLWFEDPYQSMGFVLDDFPKRPSDVPVMVRLKAIPDVILQLHADEIILRQRTIEEGLISWKTQMEAERQRQLYNNQLTTMKWEEQRKERIEHLMEARRQRRYALKKADREIKEEKPVRPYMEDLEETDEETDRSTFRTKSQVSFDSVAEQDDLNEVMKLVGEEIPEPVFEENWESVEDVTERLEAVFDSSYSVNRDYITSIKELCLDAPIPWKSINADINLTSSCNQAFILADEYKFRTESLFERCYDITVEVAERLLASGYYFLSHFGRTCPVQYHIGDIPIQLFIPMEQKFNIYPIIHRQYIYFTVGPSHRDAFRKDPLKYTAIKAVDFPLIPLKLAIIGPPKCGKTALAERFRSEFGMKVITRGQAARYVLSYLSHTVLAKAMETTLRKGFELTDRMTMGSVEASAFDPRVVTQGVVFDGFPNSIKEMKHLAAMGFTPHLICDLYTDDLDMYNVILSEAIKQYDPPYSMRFMEHRFNVWNDTQKHFRSWVDREYQILAKIPIYATMWNVWVKSYELAKAAMYEIKHYHIHAKDDWPLRLSYMQVTPLEFKERRSTYKHFCPCCLHYHNKLSSKGCPPDRTGLVHYRRYFYYLCANHIDEFLVTPQKFIPPYNNHKLPDDLPERVKLKKIPRNVHEDGYCVTCLKHSGKSVLGVLDIAVRYKEVVYLFDTLKCMEDFMSYPEEFSSVEVMIKGQDIKYPTLDYQTLPILGTLEQFVAGQIIKAINSVASHRPIIPGLTVAQSALVGVGLYLKLQNANIPPENSARYKEGLIEYHKRRQILMNYLAIMKKYRNPYLFYQESMPKLKVSTWIREKFGRILPRPTDGSNTSSS